MTIRIITADERLSAAGNKTSVAIFGPPGVGKTSLLKTLPADKTVCLDLEAGMKPVQDWSGASIPVRSFGDFRDLVVLIGGPDPAVDPNAFYSAQHHQHVRSLYAGSGVEEFLATMPVIFVDSITDLTRQVIAFAKQQPEAFSDRTGKPDIRGAYGLLGREVIQALTRIARCGRAVPIQQGGIVRIIRDQPQTIPVAMFGPRNIVKGSFKIKYVMPGEDTADAVTVEYFSSRTWKPDETTAKLPDSQGDNPAKVNLFGCTAKDHAQREGLYIAANNRYRRRLVTFRTELEGMIPTYGDLVAVTHDMPRWGQGGEVIGHQGDLLALSEPLEWTEGATHYLGLRRRDGGLAGPYRVQAVPGDPTLVRVLDPLTVTPTVGGSEERTYFSFGPG